KIISRQDARTQKGYVVYAPVSGISTNSSPNRWGLGYIAIRGGMDTHAEGAGAIPSTVKKDLC
ncbi:MAG: hypothetical protein ACOYOO_12275, partial [Saprospiraceae bacterium]